MIDIDSLLANKENVKLEAKLAAGGLPGSVWETYSSFANSFGGIILLGVDEIKETGELIPKGVKEPRKMIADIWNTLNNPQKVSANILLEKHIYSVEYKGISIVVMEVPRADRANKPIYVGFDNVFNGSYRRNNDGDYHCSREEVLSMLRDQSRETPDGKIVDKMTLGDLDSESIRRYRIMFKNIKPTHRWTKLEDDEFLIKIGAAKIGEDGKPHPTMAGLAFFGEYIQIIDELPDFFLDYRERLSNTSRWSDRVCSSDGDWSGNIFDFYFKIIDRLTSDVKKPFQLNADSVRVDNTPIHDSIREALANALIHADYYGRCGIVIEKEFRSITFTNPGVFRLDVDDAIAGGISDARNSRIFNMFSLINIGERSGSGLCSLYSIWDEIGFIKPTITESLNPDRTTLALQIELDKNDNNNSIYVDKQKSSNVNGANHGVDGANRGVDGVVQFDSLDKQIIEQLQINPSLSVKQLSEMINTPFRTTQRRIAQLKEQGVISREGNNKSGKWIILK